MFGCLDLFTGFGDGLMMHGLTVGTAHPQIYQSRALLGIFMCS